jgi:hypothetical protein
MPKAVVADLDQSTVVGLERIAEIKFSCPVCEDSFANRHQDSKYARTPLGR